MLAGPPAASASVTSWAAAVRATFHDVGTSPSGPAPDSPRTSGAVRRSSLFTASKSKRPRSHIQPQLTGSESTPR